MRVMSLRNSNSYTRNGTLEMFTVAEEELGILAGPVDAPSKSDVQR